MWVYYCEYTPQCECTIVSAHHNVSVPLWEYTTMWVYTTMWMYRCTCTPQCECTTVSVHHYVNVRLSIHHIVSVHHNRVYTTMWVYRYQCKCTTVHVHLHVSVLQNKHEPAFREMPWAWVVYTTHTETGNEALRPSVSNSWPHFPFHWAVPAVKRCHTKCRTIRYTK